MQCFAHGPQITTSHSCPAIIITTPSIKHSVCSLLSEVHITGAVAGLYCSLFQQLFLFLTVLIHSLYLPIQ